MAEARLKIEPEVEGALKQLSKGANFLLSGGAGSGKTYSLVNLVRSLFDRSPATAIACITYTRAAADEIRSRISSRNLQVGTIHEFLWSCIGAFQKELKASLISVLNDPDIKLSIDNTVIPENFFDEKKIEYKEYLLLREGIISHDELLPVANRMFRDYPKLRRIVADRLQYIFVDEYQDTSKYVIEIFLDYYRHNARAPLFGFFGDAMQAIYEDGIGDLKPYLAAGVVTEVPKTQNRRNPQSIIDLANKLRIDGIVQKPSDDESAPNMKDGKVVEGSVKFYYSSAGEDLIEALKQTLGWDFTDPKLTKELNLTHNMIAPRAGFPNLMEIYDKDRIVEYKKRLTDYIKKNEISEDFTGKTFAEVRDRLLELAGNKAKQILPTDGQKLFIDENPGLYAYAERCLFEEFRKIYLDKEQLIDDKKDDEGVAGRTSSNRDALVKHLYRIETNISLYEDGNVGEFLLRTDFKINSMRDKITLKEAVDTLRGMGSRTIEDVINFADKTGICRIDDRLTQFQTKRAYVFHRVKQVRYSEFQKLFEYLEGKTPFSTQHKIKGREFENVLVVLDNGNWNHFNFEALFTGNAKETILERTRKIFYVCCTRSKNNLALYYRNPSPAVLAVAKDWFGAGALEKLE
ncbi:ATP-dependent helicase [Rhizobium leguminosarum]|uniref:ATP-dependent helicase n=1 Tax=Rhizobium leguminosarum TaxID=384 RepID=UPI001030F987|nr:ATP-dependent helicase [Rhizobium leguminosarum]TAY15999.1 ATP-dependent helicase [Rhizobium leguminosarum]